MTGLPKEFVEAEKKRFEERFKVMGRLAGTGRLVEGALKIADQVERQLDEAKDLKQLMKDERVIPNEPRAAREQLFMEGDDRDRVELAVDLANSLAHFEYWHVKRKVDKYNKKFGLKAIVKDEPLKGYEFTFRGHVVEEDGSRIDTITMWYTHDKRNLITEQFDFIEHNGYVEAAEEIMKDAWQRIQKRVPGIATKIATVGWLRAFSRGEKVLMDDE